MRSPLILHFYWPPQNPSHSTLRTLLAMQSVVALKSLTPGLPDVDFREKDALKIGRGSAVDVDVGNPVISGASPRSPISSPQPSSCCCCSLIVASTQLMLLTLTLSCFLLASHMILTPNYSRRPPLYHQGSPWRRPPLCRGLCCAGVGRLHQWHVDLQREQQQ